MIYSAEPVHLASYAFVVIVEGRPTPMSQQVLQKWAHEIRPHYFAPSSRQVAVSTRDDSDAEIVRLPEAELDSPNFVPAELKALVERGFERRNGWR